ASEGVAIANRPAPSATLLRGPNQRLTSSAWVRSVRLHSRADTATRSTNRADTSALRTRSVRVVETSVTGTRLADNDVRACTAPGRDCGAVDGAAVAGG